MTSPFSLKILIHQDIESALPIWEEVERTYPASIYQTRRWLLPWIEYFGTQYNVRPFFLVAYDAEDQPALFLPLGIKEWRGIRFAFFLGGFESNANLGFVRPNFYPSPGTLTILLRESAARLPEKIDLFILLNQPCTWEGKKNIFWDLPHQASPSLLYQTFLQDSFDSFLSSHLSSKAKKKLFKKKRALFSHHSIEYRQAQTEKEISSSLDAFFVQKEQRFKEKKMTHASLFHPFYKAFLAQLAHLPSDSQEPSLEFHILWAEKEIIALYGGMKHRNSFYAMINSFNPLFASYSPGDLLLMFLLEAQIKEKMKIFDLGIGEASYKDKWCAPGLPLFDSILPLSQKGKCLAPLLKLFLYSKRLIKRHPFLLKISHYFRSFLQKIKRNIQA